MLFLVRFTIIGHSMEPVLKNGSTVIASSLPYLFRKPKINDIIVIKHPKSKKILVKRLIKIEKSEYFVAGDNRLDSIDSKNFGLVRKKDIIGKVFIYY